MSEQIDEDRPAEAKAGFEQAAEDYTDIRELEKCPAWSRYYLRRIKRKVDLQREKILFDTTVTAENFEQERARLWALIEVLDMTEIDKDDCQRVMGDI